MSTFTQRSVENGEKRDQTSDCHEEEMTAVYNCVLPHIKPMSY